MTGAGKGIGRELCKLLAACGAKVVALSRTQSDLDSLSAEIDGGCETFVCDLGDAAAVAAAAEAVLAAGPCPLLVNNAAIAINGPFLEASTDDFDTLYAINVRSVMQVSQILAKAMIAAGGGGVRCATPLCTPSHPSPHPSQTEAQREAAVCTGDRERVVPGVDGGAEGPHPLQLRQGRPRHANQDHGPGARTTR